MASLITHLLVGKHVFHHIWRTESSATNYSAFLLGCLIVDVNRFSNINRSLTHFVKHSKEAREKHQNSSCVYFLNQLDELLLRPWESLSIEEHFFIAGYLCHLAADEIWRESGWQLLKTLKLSSMPELPVSGTVMLTAYDILCKEKFTDFDTVAPDLNSISVPDVFKNIAYDSLSNMWEIIRPHIMDGSTPDSYFQMLALSGKTEIELKKTRKEHDLYLEKAISLISKTGGVDKYISAATEQAVNVLPQLWKNKSR